MISNNASCVPPPIPFDPTRHKKKYRVGVHAIRADEEAFEEYNKTFGEFLTATAGRAFDPPIEFEMVPLDFQRIFERAYSKKIDFLYAGPGIYSCIGVETGALPVATIISRLNVRGRQFDLDVFGGVIFTRADNYEVETVRDLKGKIIGAASLTQIQAGQQQFYEMIKAGLSYVMDPKQVIFTYQQEDVVNGVLDGTMDVGFVRTDTIERTTDEEGEPIDTNLFKVVSPKVHIMENGDLFPFLHSTPVYAEWPVSALPHVATSVTTEVQRALLSFQEHADAGAQLRDGKIKDYKPRRCDTTPELAWMALEGSDRGSIAGFRPSMSYFGVRTMQEAAGFLQQNERGDWSCVRVETFYDNIQCPKGFYKKRPKIFDKSCSKIGLSCREGWDCYCSPCTEAQEVAVYPFFKNGHWLEDADEEGCDKMSVCGRVQQTKSMTFRADDKLIRKGAKMEVAMHIGGRTENVPVSNVSNFTYQFNWTSSQRGVGVMEIKLDGVQIPSSPLRVMVIERDCDEDFPGQNREPSTTGKCMCKGQTVAFGSKCVSTTSVAVTVSIVFVIIACICGLHAMQIRNRKNDQVWLIKVEDLLIEDPIEIIGEGTFGQVIKAEYRGTPVAIKRIIKRDQRETKKGSKEECTPEASSDDTNPGKGLGDSDSDDLKGHHSASVLTAQMSDCDLEAQDESSEIADPTSGWDLDKETRDMFMGAGFSFSFSNSFTRRRTKLLKWFMPWVDDNSFQNRAKLLMGAVGSETSRSRSTFAEVLFPCCDEHAIQKNAFINEMRLLSRLRHPCITTVMGAVIQLSHEPMLVMEYCQYGSLSDLLANNSVHIGGEIILQICRDISQGLLYLHASKPAILHGDLKAKNILIDGRFRAKVCDFGLSNKKRNSLSGTPFWMAPEYLRGKSEYTCACDIYSIGMVLYEIFARKTPYHGEKPRDVLRSICNPRKNKRPVIPKSMPPKFVELVKKCWSADPCFRPQARDLDALFSDYSIADCEPIEQGTKLMRKQRTTGEMLYQVFPRHIADALKAGEKVEPESHELVTIFFSDIVKFTNISATLSPLKVSHMLDRLYMAFDTLAETFGVFKIETIGDAWMGVTNLGGSQAKDHVKRIAQFAIEATNAASNILIDEDHPSRGYVQIRAGFHSGHVVSNVIGSLNPRYGLFGDTVNVASRMESNSLARRVHCSEISAKLLRKQAPDILLIKRGRVGIKGKGDMTTYWVGTGGMDPEPQAKAKKDDPMDKSKTVEFLLDPDFTHVGHMRGASVDVDSELMGPEVMS